VTDSKTIAERLTITFRQVRDGYLSGHTTMLGQTYDVEAFRVQPERWNIPDNKRHRRMRELLEGLLIDDVPLNQVEINGFEGKWLVFVYPGEDIHYGGESQ